MNTWIKTILPKRWPTAETVAHIAYIVRRTHVKNLSCAPKEFASGSTKNLHTKDEYIAKVSESNKNLEAQLLETQNGLTEIYEQMLSAASV